MRSLKREKVQSPPNLDLELIPLKVALKSTDSFQMFTTKIEIKLCTIQSSLRNYLTKENIFWLRQEQKVLTCRLSVRDFMLKSITASYEHDFFLGVEIFLKYTPEQTISP